MDDCVHLLRMSTASLLWKGSFTTLVGAPPAHKKHKPKRSFQVLLDWWRRFPDCVARVPVSLWGSGGKAVFAKCCVCVRNRSQPFATVFLTAVRLSTVANAPGVVSKVSSVDLCYRSYIGVCRGSVCVGDPWCRMYIGVLRGSVCVPDLWRRSYHGFCREGVCVSDLRLATMSRKRVKRKRPGKVSRMSVPQGC